jgi:polar amino acid transport system substrate-binding protein
MLVIVSGCSSSGKEDKLDQIKKAGVIKIGTNSGYPPYEFYDSSNNQKKLVGYDIELGNYIGSKLGVKVEWVDIDFDALIPSLQSGKFDIIMAGMVATEDRKKSVAFSEEYYHSETVALAKKSDIANFKDTSMLKGKKIVVQSGTTQEKAAQAVSGAEVVSLPTVSDTVSSLTSGKVDCLFIAQVSAENIIKKYPEYAFTTINGIKDDLKLDGASIALPQDEASLKAELDKIIAELKASKELDKMFNNSVDLYEKISK